MDEKREFPRFIIELNAKIITEDGKESLCKLIDISKEGIRIELFSKEKIEIGTRKSNKFFCYYNVDYRTR